MTFPDAKKEFGIRYYLWAAADFGREINESFPGFHSFNAGSVWETHQFMQQLNRGQQLALARGLLKRFHPEAVKHLGESCSPEEESLRSQRDDFFRIRSLYQSVQRLERSGKTAEACGLFQRIRPAIIKNFGEPFFNDEKSLRARLDEAFCYIPVTFEEQLAARKKAGEKIAFAAKRVLRKAMTAKFKKALGTQCFGIESVDEEDEPTFQMKCDGWILCTHFWFGRQKGLIHYNHSVASETIVDQQGAHGTYMGPLVVGSYISFTAWLGISGQILWEDLTKEEVEPACDAVIKHCRHFFEVAPKLLKGLNAGEPAKK